jgi:signal transduction histidine kinase
MRRGCGRATIAGVTTFQRSISSLWRLSTYRRWVHLVLGGVLFVPIALAVAVVTSLLVPGGADPSAPGTADLVVVLVAAALGGTLALIRSVASQQVALARALLGGPLAAQPELLPTAWTGRARCAVWTTLHLLVGLTVSLATMVGLTEAAMLALTPLATEPTSLFGPAFVDAVTATAGGWAGPAMGAAIVVALVYLVALVGAGAARVAPVLLGPSATDRLAAAQARADDLTRRNRLAAELHDTIGHALSVVSLQAAAAAKVLERDPAFARDALEAIADQARTATAELDHVLGVIRDEPNTTTPPRTLAELPQLVDGARVAGTAIRVHRHGSLDDLPPVLSRELYRWCQEAITNAVRHGDTGAPVDLELTRTADSVELVVTNATAGRRHRRSGGGHGLPLMRERVRLLGGDLDARADAGRWSLRARVPLDRAGSSSS